MKKGLKELDPLLDPFYDIDPRANEDSQIIAETLASQGDIDFFATRLSAMKVMMKTNGNLKEFQ